MHEFGAGYYGGKGVFVLRADAINEDGGWLVTYVQNQTERTSEFIVSDTQDFTAEPVAQVVLPQRVSFLWLSWDLDTIKGLEGVTLIQLNLEVQGKGLDLG